jgi:methyltransferase-like protein 6
MTASEYELSTAAYYCNFYHSTAVVAVPESKPSTIIDGFWQEDTWTDKDYRSAEALLQANLSRSVLPTHKIDKHVQNSKDWDSFYSHNKTKFYNDRHYLQREFEKDFNGLQNDRTLVEIGAGVGNNILPLMESKPTWTIYGFDLSGVAIDFLRQEERFLAAQPRATVAVWDITSLEVPPVESIADISTLLFCLSAIHPAKMEIAMGNVAKTLKPGGILLFRDYGRYDEAQLKLGIARGQRLAENFYVKQDGTKCYYFCLEDMERLCDKAGLQVLELKYLKRVYSNRAQDQQRRRVWVQGRFQKM